MAMKYRLWNQKLKIEKSYEKALLHFVKIFVKIAKKSSKIESFKKAMKKFQNSSPFKRYISSIVKRMVKDSSSLNAKVWKKAISENRFYKLLKKDLSTNYDDVISEQLTRNASIISTLPNDVANKVVKDIEAKVIEGYRASEIEDSIVGLTSKHSKALAKLIARTEVAKTQAMIVQVRAERVGIRWYVWRTSRDARVRDSHKLMDNVIVSWKNPPSPEILNGEKPPTRNAYYNAGETYNCRCYAEPLLEIDDVAWPHKVYYDSTIKMMSKSEFKSIY